MGVLSNDHQLVSGHQYFDDNVQIEGTLLGRKKEIYTAVDGEIIDPGLSGGVIVLSNDINVKLPAPSPGLSFRFVNNADDGTANTITSTVDGVQAANLLSGTIQDGDSLQATKDDDVITFTTSKHEGDYVDITCVGAGSSAVASTMDITIDDGDDATAGKLAEDSKITLISTDGTTKTYQVTDTAGGGAATTGTVLTDGMDTGAGTATGDEIGNISVQVTAGTTTQNGFLVQLRNAIMHANGHNGKILVSTGATDTNGDGVPDEASGNQTITLTQATAGLGGNTVVTRTALTAITAIGDFTEGDGGSGEGDFQWHFDGVSSDNSGMTAG